MKDNSKAKVKVETTITIGEFGVYAGFSGIEALPLRTQRRIKKWIKEKYGVTL